MLALLALLSTAPTAVQSVDADFVARGRERAVPIRVTFPAGGTELPLIIACHGMGGSRAGLEPLARKWAESGYVVVRPTFADSFAARRPTSTNLQTEAATRTREWRNRVDEVKAILDDLDQVERLAPAVAGRIDRSRIGVGGHSFGAHTSQLLGGTRIGGMDVSDPRPKAFLLISPQGTGRGLLPGAWSEFTRPQMSITGSEDVSPTNDAQTPERRKDAFLNSPSKSRYLVWIEGANHGFGGINGRQGLRRRGTADPKMVEQIGSITTTFWDAYVKGDDEAKKKLADARVALGLEERFSVQVGG